MPLDRAGLKDRQAQQAVDGALAIAEYHARVEATLKMSEHLRQLRLAREYLYPVGKVIALKKSARKKAS